MRGAGLLLALCAAGTLTACSAGGSAAVNTSAVSASVVNSSVVESSVVKSSVVKSSETSSPGAATTPNSLTAAPPPSPAVPPPSPVPPVTTATSSTPTAQPAPGTAESSGFTSSIAEIDDALAARMGSSWRPGCPVPLADLRYLTVTYRGFDGSDHSGELVVAASVAADVVEVFHRLYDDGFPLASLRLVDDFGGSDDQSMDADNSSAFNCRAITGGGGFSEHSYGTAIDLNPVENPYLSGGTVLPPQGRQFLDRSPGPGVITAGDQVVAAFASIGWTWGGTWSGPIDYQHFSASGR
ncbi:MAG TPA: M15 family metallopeptidase [Nakamurella sp.]